MMSKKPRILIYDVETKPVLAWIWSTGKQFINHTQIREGQKFDIICVCYQWLGEKTIHSLDWGIQSQDSGPMIDKFTKVIEQADLVIAHNGDKFDMRQINTQRLLKDQPPISWPTSEDTLKQLRKHFYFPSYKLDYISKTLLGEGKDHMVFQDWINIVDKKDPKSLSKMIKYCKRDVRLLGRMFARVSKYMTVKSTLSENREACPRCTSTETQKSGYYWSKVGKRQKHRCLSCHHIFKDTRALKDDSGALDTN